MLKETKVASGSDAAGRFVSSIWTSADGGERAVGKALDVLADIAGQKTVGIQAKVAGAGGELEGRDRIARDEEAVAPKRRGRFGSRCGETAPCVKMFLVASVVTPRADLDGRRAAGRAVGAAGTAQRLAEGVAKSTRPT